MKINIFHSFILIYLNQLQSIVYFWLSSGPKDYAAHYIVVSTSLLDLVVVMALDLNRRSQINAGPTGPKTYNSIIYTECF